MRVLAVLHWLGLGGIETCLLKAVPLLQEQGLDLDVCCTGPPSVLDDSFEALGCRTLRVPRSPNCSETARQIHQILKRENYSLVHSQFGYTSGGIAQGAAQASIPCVVSLHSCEPLSMYRWKNRPLLSTVRQLWLAWHRRLINKHASYILGHSRTNISAFNPHWEQEQEKHGVIYNGVDIPSGFSLTKSEARNRLGLRDDGENLILHVGSYRPEKNHIGLLEVFQRILQRQPDSTLIMVGDGTARPNIETRAREMGIHQKLRFEGAKQEVWPYYRAADLFLFPSLTEGFGNALVESGLARLPVVASDISAHRESVATSQHEFLFSLPDYDQAAELAILQLDASRQGKNDWVVENEIYAKEHFSVKRFATCLSDTYHQVVQKAA